MHLGRERPPQNWARDRDRGGGRGGRSRPRCLAHCCGRPRSRRHGRHRAPPGAARRSRSLAKTSTNRSEVNHVHAAARFDGERRAQKGEHSSRVCVPPCFSSFEVQRSATGSGTGGLRWEWDCGYEGPCEPLRGSILTRVPPSSIDRSAPRSMSSRCASSALATMRTAPSESRS